jgi:hypothetical protein
MHGTLALAPAECDSQGIRTPTRIFAASAISTTLFRLVEAAVKSGGDR